MLGDFHCAIIGENIPEGDALQPTHGTLQPSASCPRRPDGKLAASLPASANSQGHIMNRRDLFLLSTAMGLTAALPKIGNAKPQQALPNPLRPPAEGSIPVAFLLSDGAVVIDFAGPWEVFENVSIPGRTPEQVFQPYTVAETAGPIRASGGMTIVPEYTFATEPVPKIIVVPAQSAPSDAMIAWVKQVAQTADLTMSVCTGAFLLAKTGLLS